ncbi:hypothetical protein K488DRAFT_44707 [Vararia minispora EC-137]|uniref:Uncharacterized protein n=1 Tax=Vararia minispora EC-137 TaxID=1314806 RepID=A0ACB8QTP0_9AGAM|nr:hypothetical protein K488DRAFT_44707 [Vararia minispora EC-137]
MTNNTNPYYGPDEDATTIFLERTFVAGDLLCGVGYGVQLVMYVYCAHYLWTQRRARTHALFILAFITALLAVSTIFVGVQAYTVQLVYIDNRNYPGGPWAYFLASQNLSVNVMFEATLFMINFLSDALVLWRCWIIWRAAGRAAAYTATAFPALMLTASFVMGTLWTLQSSQPGLSFYSALPMAYGISYYTISLSINVVLTLLIVARLLWYRRTLLRSLPPAHARHYLSLATVLVESATLYSLFALGFLISYAVSNPINQIFLTLAQSSQQISTYLIIYRLADGRAWRADTLAHETLTTMQFDERPARAKAATVDLPDTQTSDSDGAPSSPDTPYTPEKEGEGTWDGRRRKVQYAV